MLRPDPLIVTPPDYLAFLEAMMYPEDVYGVPGQQTGLMTCFTSARANVTQSTQRSFLRKMAVPILEI